MRRYRLIALLCAAASVASMVGVTMLEYAEPDARGRYVQHEEAVQVADLPEAERAAASSSTIDTSTFATHLPVVSIDTAGVEIPGRILKRSTLEALGDAAPPHVPRTDVTFATLAADGRATIPARVEVFDAAGDAGDGDGTAATGGADADAAAAGDADAPRANRLSDAPVLSLEAEVRVRGHSSRHFDKKSYAIGFTEEDRVTEVDADVLGMGADDNWVLHGPFLDKTLLRNYICYQLAGEIMPYTPDTRFCEVFLNGSYQGVYLCMESVKFGQDRVALTPTDPRYAQTSYIVKRDWADKASQRAIDDFLGAAGIAEKGTSLELLYPTASTLTEAQRAWIISDVDAIEKALYSYDYDTKGYGIFSVLDVDSFVDYLLVSELTLNADAGSYSTYFYKDARGPLAVGPVWDFNNAFDNYMDRELGESGFITPEKPLFFMLYRDDAFCERLIVRWRELRSSLWTDERIIALIDGARAYLGPAIERNYRVWGYSFDPATVSQDARLAPAERNPATYDQALEQLKSAALDRAAWLDRNIEHVRMYSHESAVRPYNH